LPDADDVRVELRSDDHAGSSDADDVPGCT
jgi:hypothetical protein